MRLLHFADLHLDRAFGGMAFSGCDSGRRRGLLRQALEWVVDEALTGRADMVTIGGDLFELEHVTSDTAAFMIRQLGRLTCPVLVAAGNHDYSSPASPYRTLKWPANVTLALEPHPVKVESSEAVVWSLGYAGREIDQGALTGFRPPADGRAQLLVVHGVDLERFTPDLPWGGLGLQPETVREMGFDHALLGHIHAGRVGEVISWPGSLVPLDPSETTGNHGALWVDARRGAVTVEAVPAGLAAFDGISVGIEEATDSSDVEARVRAELTALAGRERALVTCRIWGRRRPGLAVDPAALAAALADAALGVRVVDDSTLAVDLTELAKEPNARGKAVARLLEDGSEPALRAAALVAQSFETEVLVPV